MDDCASMDWESVRATHRQVLSEIELKRLKWDDTAGVKEAKAIAINRVRCRPTNSGSKRKEESVKKFPCTSYQTSDCHFTGDHQVDSGTALHCCAHCYKKNGATNPHTKRNCRKLQQSNKSKIAKGYQKEAHD